MSWEFTVAEMSVIAQSR